MNKLQQIKVFPGLKCARQAPVSANVPKGTPDIASLRSAHIYLLQILDNISNPADQNNMKGLTRGRPPSPRSAKADLVSNLVKPSYTS